MFVLTTTIKTLLCLMFLGISRQETPQYSYECKENGDLVLHGFSLDSFIQLESVNDMTFGTDDNCTTSTYSSDKYGHISIPKECINGTNVTINRTVVFRAYDSLIDGTITPPPTTTIQPTTTQATPPPPTTTQATPPPPITTHATPTPPTTTQATPPPPITTQATPPPPTTTPPSTTQATQPPTTTQATTQATPSTTKPTPTTTQPTTQAPPTPTQATPPPPTTTQPTTPPPPTTQPTTTPTKTQPTTTQPTTTPPTTTQPKTQATPSTVNASSSPKPPSGRSVRRKRNVSTLSYGQRYHYFSIQCNAIPKGVVDHVIGHVGVKNVASLPNVFNSIGTVEMRFKSEEASTDNNKDINDLPDISTVYLGDKFYMYLKYIGQQDYSISPQNCTAYGDGERAVVEKDTRKQKVELWNYNDCVSDPSKRLHLMHTFKNLADNIVYAEMFGFHFDIDADITIECDVKVCTKKSTDPTCKPITCTNKDWKMAKRSTREEDNRVTVKGKLHVLEHQTGNSNSAGLVHFKWTVLVILQIMLYLY